jgi:hypothetical protein
MWQSADPPAGQAASALAGNGDVFAAPAADAFVDAGLAFRLDGQIGLKGPQPALDAVPLIAPWWNYERFPRHLQHLPRDY